MMFKQTLIHGIVSAILASIACLIYTGFYFSVLVDFSEAAGTLHVISTCFMVVLAASFIHFGIRKVINNENIADTVFGLLFAACSLGSVFYILKSNDPVFKNEDAALMIDYYKGFVMPMLFFPALAWFSVKPLFLNKRS
ncbi:MAG: hypothetical protein EP305_11280 [Bacteroidetes bacterium]|nr:MAG: hypothetical protein EP305_11280 [Bacteroidota bacterium]